MKVKELIEMLGRCDPEATLHIGHANDAQSRGPLQVRQFQKHDGEPVEVTIGYELEGAYDLLMTVNKEPSDG